jgi:hypothetical protein
MLALQDSQIYRNICHGDHADHADLTRKPHFEMTNYIFYHKILNNNLCWEFKVSFLLYASMQTPLKLHTYRNKMSTMLISCFFCVFVIYGKPFHQCYSCLSFHELVTAQV